MQREKNNNFILDFTGVYDDEFAKEKTSLTWIDCTDITGCDMYVSDEAEKQIGERVDSVGIHGIHFLDSGNYHYVTKIMTDRIKEPFSLVVFDHHTDMQKPMIEGLTSCGDWAGKVIKDNPYICQLILVGPEKKDINAIGLRSNKLITYSEMLNSEEYTSARSKLIRLVANRKRESTFLNAAFVRVIPVSVSGSSSRSSSKGAFIIVSGVRIS